MPSFTYFKVQHWVSGFLLVLTLLLLPQTFLLPAGVPGMAMRQELLQQLEPPPDFKCVTFPLEPLASSKGNSCEHGSSAHRW